MWPKVSRWLHSPAAAHVGHVGHPAHAVHSHGRAVPTAVVAAVHGALTARVWVETKQHVTKQHGTTPHSSRGHRLSSSTLHTATPPPHAESHSLKLPIQNWTALLWANTSLPHPRASAFSITLLCRVPHSLPTNSLCCIYTRASPVPTVPVRKSGDWHSWSTSE